MKPNLKRKKLANIPLSENCKAIILGSLLGNGSLVLSKGNINAHLNIKLINEDHYNWLKINLKEISYSDSLKMKDYNSICSESLTEIYNITYHKNKLNLKRCWLNHFTELSLFIWWLDSIHIINGKEGIIYTNYDKKSAEIIKNYLKIVWKIKVKLETRKSNDSFYINLFFDEHEFLNFINIISPYISHPFMINKFLPYKNKEIQQRWISNFKENDIVQ